MLTLAIVDNGDGTGATATVGGTSGGAVAVYTQPGSAGPGTGWELAGTRTGDGTLTLPGVGYWWAYAILASGGPSAITPYATTQSTLAVLIRLQNGLTSILQSKTFPPATNGAPPNIVAQKAPDVKLTGLPAIILSIAGLTESPAAKAYDSEGNDETGFPVAIGVYDHSDRQYQDGPIYSLWRQVAMLAVQNRKIAGVPELYRTVIEPQPQAVVQGKEDATPEYQAFRSSFIVRGLAILQRG